MSLRSAFVPGVSRRWWGAVAIVLLAQVGFIFFVGEKRFPQARLPSPSPGLLLDVNSASEMLELKNPTLFALPNKHSFAGMAWLKTTPLTFVNSDWVEEPDWYQVPARELGAAISRFSGPGFGTTATPDLMPTPELVQLRVQPELAAVSRSSVSVDGELASWGVSLPRDLPSWPARRVNAADIDLLTNTVVRVVADRFGRPVSMALLQPSGSSAADEFALEQVRRARFVSPEGSGDPGPGESASQLRWGRVVFAWHTLPTTNTPVTLPSEQ